MNASLKPIICCGFTPCVQRIIECDFLEKGAVNRARKVTTTIGGKGANTARMIKQQGGHPVVVGFVGGANGRLFEQMLDEEEVGYRHIVVEGETRICQTLVEEGHPEATELVEEMPPLTVDNWQHMIKLFESLELADTIVPVSGKLPAGAPVDAYAQICKLVHEQGGRVILDAPGDPLLLALVCSPAVVKINDTELRQALGEMDLKAACHEIMARGAKAVMITRGHASAFYMDKSRSYEIFPPAIDAVNPVGSGDAVTAGLAVDLSRGRSISEAIITGMACGAANALQLVSGLINPDDIDRLRSAVRVEKI